MAQAFALIGTHPSPHILAEGGLRKKTPAKLFLGRLACWVGHSRPPWRAARREPAQRSRLDPGIHLGNDFQLDGDRGGKSGDFDGGTGRIGFSGAGERLAV